MNEREQQYLQVKCQPKNEKYANGSVGARVRLMVRGDCLPVGGSKGMEWKYDDDLCICGTKETEIHLFFECKCYEQKMDEDMGRLQTTQPTSGGAVTANSSCCANCVEPPRPSNGGPIYRFWACPPCGPAGAVAHKRG